MREPHKHAELIKAWADGAAIETKAGDGPWVEAYMPEWWSDQEYRIKPEPKPDVVELYWVKSSCVYMSNPNSIHNLKLTFDGETGKLKSAEVL